MKFKEEHGSAGTQIASILVAIVAAILTIHATAVFLERQMINDAIEMSYISIDYASKISSVLDSVPNDSIYDKNSVTITYNNGVLFTFTRNKNGELVSEFTGNTDILVNKAADLAKASLSLSNQQAEVLVNSLLEQNFYDSNDDKYVYHAELHDNCLLFTLK